MKQAYEIIAELENHTQILKAQITVSEERIRKLELIVRDLSVRIKKLADETNEGEGWKG